MSLLIECKQIHDNNILFYWQFGGNNTTAPAASACAHLTTDKLLTLSAWTTAYTRLESFVVANLQAHNVKAAERKSLRHRTFGLGESQFRYTADWLDIERSMVGQKVGQLFNATNEESDDAAGGGTADGDAEKKKSRKPILLHTHFVHVRVQFADKDDRKTRRIRELEDTVDELKEQLSGKDDRKSRRIRELKDTVEELKQKLTRNATNGTDNTDKMTTADNATKSAISKSEKTHSEKELATAKNTKEPVEEIPEQKPDKTSPTTVAAPDKPLSAKTKPSTSTQNRKRVPSVDMFEGPSSSSSPSTLPAADELPARRRRIAVHANLNENTLHPRIRSFSLKESSKPAAAKSTVMVPKKPRKVPLSISTIRSPSPPLSVSSASSSSPSVAAAIRRKRVDESIAKIRDMLKPPEVLPNIEVLDLKHLSVAEIDGRLKDDLPQMRVFFEAYLKGNTHKVPRPIDMPVYAVNYLLSEAQQLHMIDQLMFEFGGRENLARFDDLFWNRMLPEWCLSIFMFTYRMTREEATERMRIQEKITLSKFRMDDDDDSFLLVK